MNLRKLYPIILITLLISSCRPIPEKGVVTKIDSSNQAKFWLKKDCTLNSEGLLLENQGAVIASMFEVRNFEFSVQVKSTKGAEGILSFATKTWNNSTSSKGYKVFINNSDYRSGDAKKTGSLLQIRNNFVRTAYDDQWFDLSVSVKANHIKVSVNNKVISEYNEPSNPIRSADLSGMLLTKGYLTIEKTNEEGQFCGLCVPAGLSSQQEDSEN